MLSIKVMALANRRPVAIPVTETTPSPSFKPRRLSLNANFQLNSKNLKSTNNNNNNDNSDNTSLKSISTPEESSSSSPEAFNKENSPASTETSVTSVDSSTSPGEILSKLAAGNAPSVNAGSINTTNAITTTTTTKKKEKKEKVKGEKVKKSQSNRAPIATGISTTIPVTGERPPPEKHSSLDDDVLFAIFEILFQHDENGKGMTVKQICDILIEKHPDMAKLSSKTSNLVSAKLNAYVKRVEKGEKSLIYALSREWADASPKRMVYVYRGILAPDYYIHALAAIESQKGNNNNNINNMGNSNDMRESKSDFNDYDDFKSLGKRGNGFDMNSSHSQHNNSINKQTFADLQLDLTLPQLSVPYNVAPVTASLGLGNTLKRTMKNTRSMSHFSTIDSDSDEESSSRLKSFNDEDSDDEANEELKNVEDGFDELDQLTIETKVPFRTNKRSKSMSYLSSKKMRPLTIAAAAPRFQKTLSNPSPSQQAAAAALHAATLLEGLSPAGSVGSGLEMDSSRSRNCSEGHIAPKWLEAVKSGFLTQDIGTPEDLSLAELDSLFA